MGGKSGFIDYSHGLDNPTRFVYCEDCKVGSEVTFFGIKIVQICNNQQNQSNIARSLKSPYIELGGKLVFPNKEGCRYGEFGKKTCRSFGRNGGYTQYEVILRAIT